MELPTIIIPLRPLYSAFELYLSLYTGVRYHGICLRSIIDLEVECMVMNPDIRYYSDAYHNFFETYGVSVEDEDYFINFAKAYFAKYITSVWGRINYLDNYSWKVMGNMSLSLKHELPIEIRVHNNTHQKRSINDGSNHTNKTSYQEDGRISFGRRAERF